MLFTFLKNLFQKNGQFIYSLILIILIPSLLVINTLWILHSIDRDTNYFLRKEAVLVSDVLGTFAPDSIHDQKKLTAKLQSIKKLDPSITNITVLLPNATNTSFTSLASTSSLGAEDTDLQLSQFTWDQKTSFAAVVVDKSTLQKSWSVITPFTDASGKQIGLIDLKIAVAEVDTILSRTIQDALVVMGVSVFVTLLLLINHFKFFESARLFGRLKEVDGMKDDFISMASHELRTPLTAIRGYAELMLITLSKQQYPEALRNTNIIIEEGRRLNELVEDLLNVSRIEQNRLSFDMKTTDTTPILQAIIAELQGQADQKKLHLTFTPLTPPVMILADAERLKQIFVNLIGNAIKYSLAGEVTVSQQVEKNLLKLFVKDTGLGMSAEARERLFSKFYRIKTDQTRDIPGTGLGLWITKQLVEKMKGKIYVDSIENIGSVFTVVFPLIHQKAQ